MKNRTLRNIRLAEENQLKLFPEQEEEPCLICEFS